MSIEFIKTVSWSAGHGTNKTSKSIILSNFLHLVELLEGELFFKVFCLTFIINNVNFRCNQEEHKVEITIRNVRLQGVKRF